MEEYKEIKAMLKVRGSYVASDVLKDRINRTLDNNTQKRYLKGWVWGMFSTCAAAILVFILLPTGISAKEILRSASDFIRQSEDIGMTVKIRTRPMENFKFISSAEDFISHDIYISRRDSSLSWRLDKGGRIALGHGNEIYTWLPELNIGWRFSNVHAESVLGYLSTLLTPENIIEGELNRITSDSDAEYTISKDRDELTLIIKARPRGVFENPYILNTSIFESENIRRYVFDATNKRLKRASVSIIDKNKEIVILDIEEINYEIQFPEIAELPNDINWGEFNAAEELPGLQNLSVSEAANAILSALECWNMAVLEKVIDVSTLDALYKNDLSGSVLVSTGKPFVSGMEGLHFVPYELIRKDGTVQNANLSLYKSIRGGWLVAGGL